MKAHTVGLLVFLLLIKSFLCESTNPIMIDSSELSKHTVEGSCVEMKCKVNTRVGTYGALWYWIKDATWSQKKGNYNGTVVFSNDVSKCSEDFKGRVENISPHTTGNCDRSRLCEELCNIRICELNKNDTGTYLFRFEGNPLIWATKQRINLTVVDNPCPITFEKPSPTQENQTTTLKCSTSTSCRSNLQIYDSKQQPLQSQFSNDIRTSTSKSVEIQSTWLDDGTEYSCQTQDNNDTYLIRKVTLTVEYAPRGIEAKVSSATVKEGSSVTLNCSGTGQPKLNFTWYKENQEQFSGDTWEIPSIKEAQNGSYTCIAKNKLGEKSSTINITVTYAPHVEVQISQEPDGSLENVKEGANVKFLCDVKKSSPPPNKFVWFRNSTCLTTPKNRWKEKSVVVSGVQPTDSGIYKCRATNSVGTGESKRLFQVKYKPRNTRISPQNLKDNGVKVNSPLTMTCNTKAYPFPLYSWYRYQQTDSSKLIHVMSQEETLTLGRVQRADEACYICNASNSVGSGDVSEPLCIRVLFPPTSVVLSMEVEVIEDQLVTVTCSAESFPPSRFTLTRSASRVSLPVNDQNSVRNTFTATSTDTDEYTCIASNSEGSKQSNRMKLAVKYAPKDVKIEARHNLVVKENMSFSLDCKARSHPPVTSTTWTKVTSGKSETVHVTGSIFSVISARPSDSGFYSCKARNEIGTGESQQIEMEVHYAPKHTRIIEGEKHQLPDGTSLVPLSCFAHCYPPVRQYSWYKKAESGDIKVSDNQNISVSFHEPGEYYCVAENEIGQRLSASVPLFPSRVMKILKFFTIFCLLLFILCIVFFLYRHSIKSIQRRPANTRLCCGFLARWKASRRRNLMNEAALTRTSRSRDDLLPPQSCPDNTPSSNTDCVYSTVNLPAPSAQRPARQNGAQKEEDSLNYTSLHFEKKHRKPEEEVVYAGVSKVKPKTRNEVDYENATFAGKAPHPYDYDTDTSEDEDEDEEEVEVTYSKVTFRLKAGQQRPKRDSSTSEDNTQYSEVKI